MRKKSLAVFLTGLILLTAAGIIVSCQNDPDPESEIILTDVPEVYQKIYGATSITDKYHGHTHATADYDIGA